MKDIFTRLLKILWFFNIAFFGGIILMTISIILSGDLGIEIDNIVNALAVFICIVAALIIMQYVLLGNFNPKILFKRKSRYPR